MSEPPVILSIGGSDSGAGAGVQADLKAIAASGGYAATVVTAVTAQNTAGVRSVHPIPLEIVADQLEAVLEDLPIRAVKTGLLGRAEVVALVAERVPGSVPLVVDPVLVNSAGRQIVDGATVQAYVERLAPRATVLTPNFREAALLTGMPIGDADALEVAALQLAAQFGTTVLVTGGHLAGDRVVDVLVIDGVATRHASPRVATRNVHGTGCSTASALATRLAEGLDPAAAYGLVRPWIQSALQSAAEWRLGAGQGPIDHFGVGRRG